MNNRMRIIEFDEIVVKFVGDSGDGMQLTGSLFADAAVKAGNDLATFPDYPAEIRAPHNTLAGVSGFQVNIGKNKINTSGDFCDVLVAMNPASLKANLKWVKNGAMILVDSDAFEDYVFNQMDMEHNPLEDGSLSGYSVIKAPISTMTREAIKSINGDNKTAEKTRNMFVLGMLLYIFSRTLDSTIESIKRKFVKNPFTVNANSLILQTGYHYAETLEAVPSVYSIPPATIEKGTYRNITGNIATAWGLLAASEKSGRPLFLGSYPITPASDIMIELAKHKSLGAIVFQAEDEIAGICSAIGAS